MEAAARRYIGGSGRLGGSGAGASAAAAGAVDDGEEEDCCAICQEELADTAWYDELGEPLETMCGHRFHAVCLARHMEASEQDPTCPMCRSSNISVRFRE